MIDCIVQTSQVAAARRDADNQAQLHSQYVSQTAASEVQHRERLESFSKALATAQSEVSSVTARNTVGFRSCFCDTGSEAGIAITVILPFAGALRAA